MSNNIAGISGGSTQLSQSAHVAASSSLISLPHQPLCLNGRAYESACDAVGREDGNPFDGVL